MSFQYRVGDYVTNPKAPAWGPGKVDAVDAYRVTVRFRDVHGADGRPAIKQIANTPGALVPAGISADPVLDAGARPGPRSRKGAGPLSSLSVESAYALFLRYFPKGFEDPAYFRNERTDKWAAHEAYQHDLHCSGMEFMLRNRLYSDISHSFRHILSSVNMASPFEIAAFSDAMDDHDAVKSLAEAILTILEAGPRDEAAVAGLIRAVGNLPTKEGGSSPAKWPILTGLPFLADPKRFMFLKPEATKHFAERLGFSLNYKPQLNSLTWARVHDLGESMLEYLAPRGARDLIDVQSLIWVLHSYGEPEI